MELIVYTPAQFFPQERYEICPDNLLVTDRSFAFQCYLSVKWEVRGSY